MPELPLCPPEPKTYTGYVTFACEVERGLVEVRAYVFDDELQWDDRMEIWYADTEVSDILGASQSQQIESHFNAHRQDITAFDRDD